MAKNNVEIQNLVDEDDLNNSQQQPEILIMHPGISIEKFYAHHESSSYKDERITNILNDLRNAKQSNKLEDVFNELYTELSKFNPGNFDQLLYLYKLVCCVCLLSTQQTDNIIPKMKILHRTFQMSAINWDNNPVHIHVATKILFECLDNDQNLLYISRKICDISIMSFNISICLAWAALLRLFKREIKMFRFHKFQTIIELLEQTDINDLKNRSNYLFIMLSIVSFLQTTILKKTHELLSVSFEEYFQWSPDDLVRMLAWFRKLLKVFNLKISDGTNENADFIHITELLDFDIIHFLESMLSSPGEII